MITADISGKTNYDLGICHGKILKNYIRKFIRDIKIVLSKEYPIFRFIPLAIIVWLASPLFFKKFPKNYKDELRGIAKGSDVKLFWIIFLNSFYDISQFFISVFKARIYWGCSGFITFDKNNKMLLAKTFDYGPGNLLIKYRTFFKYNFKNDKFSFFGFPGIISGDFVNSKNKLTLSFFLGGMVDVLKNFRGWINNYASVVFQREIIKNSESIGTIKKFLQKQIKPSSSFRIMFTNGEMSNGLIDIFGNHYLVQNKSDLPVILTNHFTTKKMTKTYVKNYSQSQQYIDSSLRFNILKKNVTTGMNIEEVKDVLAMRSQDPSNGSIANSITILGVIKSYSDSKTYYSSRDRVPATIDKKYIEIK